MLWGGDFTAQGGKVEGDEEMLRGIFLEVYKEVAVVWVWGCVW